jgi:hypothetical protein
MITCECCFRGSCDPFWQKRGQRARTPFKVFGSIDGRAGTAFGQSPNDVVFNGKAWSGTLTKMYGSKSGPTVQYSTSQ